MTTDLTLICDACQKPIQGEARGYLWVDRSEVEKAQEEAAAWEKKYTVGEGRTMSTFGGLMEYPARVPWQAHHGACDPAPEAWAYDIDAEALDTYPQLLERTAHLMGKPWLPLTDWHEVLRGVHTGKTRLIVAP